MSDQECTLVSVITVCYNSEKTIRKTIESVLNQTYTNIEYIVIDGKSTDATLDAVREYSVRFGDRMKVISEPDHGIYDAMNKGIRLAKGQLIGIINSDDYYEDSAVEDIVEAWDGSSLQILHGLMRSIVNGKACSVVMNYSDWLQEKMIQHPSCFVTKDVYDKIGLFNTGYKYVADYEFMLRAKQNKDVTFVPVYSIIANFLDGGMSERSAAALEELKLKRRKGIISCFQYIILCLGGPLKSKIYKWIWNN